MPWVAGAAIAVSSLYSSNKASAAAGNAADAQVAGQHSAIGEQRREFDINQNNLQPFLTVATGGANGGALGMQANLLGINGTASQQQAYNNFMNSPGQQFLVAQGEKATLRNAAATGGIGGGNVLNALNQNAIGYASQDFGNYYNRLAGLSGTGQAAANQIGQFGANMANNISSLDAGIGSARASGILGGQQAQSQGINNAISAGMYGWNQYQNQPDSSNINGQDF